MPPPVVRWLGAAIALAGLAAAGFGASSAVIATVGGVLPGALLLAAGYRGASAITGSTPSKPALNAERGHRNWRVGTYGRGGGCRVGAHCGVVWLGGWEERLMSYGKAVREELRVPTRELRHAIPQVFAGYKQLHDSALAPGVLDGRTKELIALAIAVSKECDGCIAAHAHAAVLHGASPQEAAEAIGVTFLMNGGPATVYGARAFAAFQEFYGQQAGQPDGHLPTR